MIEVRLHGALAKEFGQCWHLDIRTPAEAVRAIECARRGFRDAILKLDQLGHVFRVRTKDHDYGNEDIGATLGSVNRIDIIPIVRGASAGVRFVVGAIMVVVGLATSWLGGAGVPVASAGFGLMVGSVVEWLTPKPKRPDPGADGLQSWTFSGPTSTADQGVPVPIIYGEVLTGAVGVSVGISVSESVNGYNSAGVAIGGNLDLIGEWQDGGLHTHVFTLSATVVGGRYPLNYHWSFTGFPGAVAARWTQQDAVAKLELDYDVNPGAGVLDTGLIQVSVEVQVSYDVPFIPDGLETLTTSAAATVWNRAHI
jgi:predicted phage tail protein